MPESVEESIDRIDNSVDESESNEPKGPNIRKNFPETFIWDTIEYV